MHIISSPGFLSDSESVNIKYSYAGYVTTDETWRQLPRYASFSRLYYVIDGAGMLTSEQGEFALEPGYVYIVPCGMKAGFYGTPSVTKLFFHINLTFDEQNDVFEKYSRFSRLPRSVEYIKELKDLYLSTSKKDMFLLKSEITATVCQFLSRMSNRNAPLKEHSKCVSDAISFIKKNIRATLTVKEVCRNVPCSATALANSFKKELGQTISAFIEEVVMSEAQSQLLYSNQSIREISEVLGYSDQFYFSRRFKKWFSTTPSKYRKKVN
jgi:AraC-like DNA-binding protein